MTDRLAEIEALHAKAYAVKRNQEPVPTVGESFALLEHIPWLVSEVKRTRQQLRALQRDADLGTRVRHWVSVEEGVDELRKECAMGQYTTRCFTCHEILDASFCSDDCERKAGEVE